MARITKTQRHKAAKPQPNGRAYSPPREEGWLRHQENFGEAHLSAADGVVAHKPSSRTLYLASRARSMLSGMQRPTVRAHPSHIVPSRKPSRTAHARLFRERRTRGLRPAA